MTQPLSPQEIQELAAGYVLGDLDSDEAKLFQALLAEVPELQAEVATLQEALALMPYELADVEVDSRVRSRLLTQAEAELASAPPVADPSGLSPSLLPATPQRQRQPSSTRAPWLISGLAAGLALVCGVVAVRMSGQVRFLQAQSDPVNDGTEVVQTWAGLDDILQDHQKSLTSPDGPVDFVVDRPADVLAQLQGFQTTVAALPLLPSEQTQLLGGSNCEFGKIQGLRLTYQLSPDQTISAYQLDLKDKELPALSTAQILLQQPDGTSLVLWRDGNYAYALVAALPLPELQALAQTMPGT